MKQNQIPATTKIITSSLDAKTLKQKLKFDQFKYFLNTYIINNSVCEKTFDQKVNNQFCKTCN